MTIRALTLLAALALVAGIARAQATHDHPGGGDLGYHDWTQPLVTPLALDETTIVLPVQGRYAYPDRAGAGLQVLRNLHGIVLVDFVPIPGNLLDADGIWHQPMKLDETSIAMPGPGPDGAYETGDDELVVVTGLDHPALAQVVRTSLRVAGPGRDEPFRPAGPRRALWFKGGIDAHMVNGEQILVIVDQIGLPGQNVQVIDMGTSYGPGAAPFFVDLDTGFVFPLTGADGFLGTSDDELGFLSFDALGNAAITNHAWSLPLHVAEDGSWPRRIGPDAVMLASPGLDLESADDDEILRIEDFQNRASPRRQPTLGHRYFETPGHNPVIGSDATGALVAPMPGPDDALGSDDDELHVLNENGLEILPALARLAPPTGRPLEPRPISADLTLVATYGSAPFNFIDQGLLLLRRDPQSGQHTLLPILLFAEPRAIVAMDETSAMVFTAAGDVHWLTGLDGAQPLARLIGPGAWDGNSRPLRISPAAVASMAAGTPDPYSLVTDTLRLHKIPAWWSYGEATPSAAGYALEPSVAGTPAIGGAACQLGLQDAPPAQPAVLIASLARARLEVTPGAFLLVEPESVFYLLDWGTFADGATGVPLLPPTDPALAGIAGHFQWLVWDPNSPRGFQLSRGLTISL